MFHLRPLPVDISFRWLWRYCLHMFISMFLSFSMIPGYIATAFDNFHAPISYSCENVVKYYEDVDGLEGPALLMKLNNIVASHRSLAYKEVWDALKILDAADVDHPEESMEVMEIYTQRAVPKMLAGKPDGWNREHLWPRSYGLTSGSQLTDLHNIRPADVNVNSSRGNKFYGECAPASTRCSRPANREAASDTETDGKKWAPPFQVRGDIARSLMYMAVSYAFPQPNGAPALQLSDTPNIGNRSMGLLSSLLMWNELDPPSRSEQLRNERVCRLYQHNRNPFVDHPEYANLIWGHHNTYTASAKSFAQGLEK